MSKIWTRIIVFLKKYPLFIDFRLLWVFVAAQGLSLAEASGSYSLAVLRVFLTAAASPVAHRL